MPYRGLMDRQPKQDAADKESVRLTDLLKRAAWVPVTCLLISCVWLKRVIIRPRSPEERHEEDKKHQSKVRRQLRGLTPVHDATKPHN